MGLRIAEVGDQKPIPKVLSNMAIKAPDHLSTGLRIGAHHVAEVFGAELAKTVESTTSQNRTGELAAFAPPQHSGRWRRDDVMTGWSSWGIDRDTAGRGRVPALTL